LIRRYKNGEGRLIFDDTIIDLSNNRKDAINDGMGREKKAADAKAVLFKRLYGVKPDIFFVLCAMKCC
jgi:hypothetical protein